MISTVSHWWSFDLTDRQAIIRAYMHPVVREIAGRASSPTNEGLLNGGIGPTACAANAVAHLRSTLSTQLGPATVSIMIICHLPLPVPAG